MKIRTCPNCGYKYSFVDYLKKMTLKLVNSSWNCPDCDSKLSFNIGRRTLVAIIGMLPIGFVSLIIDAIQNIGVSKGLSWIISFLIFLIWIIWIYSFDTFTVINKSSK